MKWQILILSAPGRNEFIRQLLAQLVLQTDGVDVGVSIQNHSGIETIGEAREQMRRKSSAYYINFVDDDDLLAPDYVSRILPLLDGVDQIGFKVQGYHNGQMMKPTIHSLYCGSWWENEYGFHRDISHINPMRRELALQVPMSGGPGEDHRWANAMRGKVKTEHYIPNVLYHYLYRNPKNDATDALNPKRLELLDSLRSADTRTHPPTSRGISSPTE